MLITGQVVKDGRWYLAEISLFDALTQGRTKKEALAMAADWVETMIGRGDVEVTVHRVDGEHFTLEANDSAAIVALALRRRREAMGLTLAEVAERLGSTSKNAYARYEQGRSVPSITKLAELLHAVDPEHDLALSIA